MGLVSEVKVLTQDEVEVSEIGSCGDHGYKT